jgi:tRNA U34 2-thiouridine synthase MnmA/TrmU
MAPIKALSLYSGGLDSILACRVIMEQGIAVKALNFITPFTGYHKKGREEEVREHARRTYGIHLEVIDVGREYTEVVAHPRHGYGKHFNPCVDCKIFFFSKARELMAAEGASFLITGEVIGQRPMSQRRDTLHIIERESGTEGILLRPLCAQHLRPTIPEKEGRVDRIRLLAFAGRGRKDQMALAARYGIKDYPPPAGGCFLADPNIAARLRWVFDNLIDRSFEAMILTTMGRHFALAEKTLLVVGRDERENSRIAQLGRNDDIELELVSLPGPLSLLRGPTNPEIIQIAAAITSFHSKARHEKQVEVIYRKSGSADGAVLRVDPLVEAAVSAYRIV